MKTHLITQSGIVSNTPDNRKASFLFLSRWTGYDESSDDLREKFALRSVEPDEDEEGNVTSHSVVYHSREEGNRERESIEVDHFTLETDAKAFADNENFRLLGEYIRDDSNFTLLDLPDGWEAEMGTVRNGKYPQSRSVEVTLHARGESYGGAAHWDCHLITDTWLDTEKVKHAIVELMDDMLSGVLDGLKKASDSATALKDAAELLAEIMRDEVNHQDEAEKWLREYAPEHLFPDTHHKTSTL